MLVKLDVQRNDGSSMASSYTYDDRGRSLAGSWKSSASDSAYDIAFTVTDWDEYGHEMKSEEANDYGDGKPFTIETETSNPKYNADGSIVSVNQVNKINKESFEEGEVASTKVTTTWEYGTNVEVLRKLETKTEHFDKSGALMMTGTQTNEFGEDGLQTRFIVKTVDAEGAEINQTGDITWTKDANGKPVSYSMVMSQDGADASTSTGDVKTNESGLISWIGNIKVDGEAYSTSVAIDYLKIDDPLPNAYEGWKSFTLTDAILSRDFGGR